MNIKFIAIGIIAILAIGLLCCVKIGSESDDDIYKH